MPRLIVNNTTFNYPDPGQEPGWSEDATAWAQSVTEVLSFLIAPGDILNGTATIANAQNSPVDVIGCQFDSTVSRSANVSYQVVRSDDLETRTESGTLFINFNAGENAWTLSRFYTDNDSNVDFSITPAGQVQYKSDEMTGNSYTGIVKFNARTLQA
jgi:hypothetical protein